MRVKCKVRGTRVRVRFWVQCTVRIEFSLELGLGFSVRVKVIFKIWGMFRCG